MQFFTALVAILPLVFALPQPQSGSVLDTPDGTCGTQSSQNGRWICPGSEYGDCCSFLGFCGNSTLHCSGGCQFDYGECNVPGNLSPDGTCGGDNLFNCHGDLGGCCSSSGFCGKGIEFCGVGCQGEFSEDGACLSGKLPSVDGTCGGTTGYTCAGGEFDGQCCSQYGFCGSTTAHCGATGGCQPEFGNCT